MSIKSGLIILAGLLLISVGIYLGISLTVFFIKLVALLAFFIVGLIAIGIGYMWLKGAVA